MTICLFLFTTWFHRSSFRSTRCSQASLPMASPCGAVRGWVQQCGSSAETKVAWPGVGWAPSSDNFTDEISVPNNPLVSQSQSEINHHILPNVAINLGIHLFPTAKSSNHQLRGSGGKWCISDHSAAEQYKFRCSALPWPGGRPYRWALWLDPVISKKMGSNSVTWLTKDTI
jgi:hypothetical protein